VHFVANTSAHVDYSPNSLFQQHLARLILCSFPLGVHSVDSLTALAKPDRYLAEAAISFLDKAFARSRILLPSRCHAGTDFSCVWRG